MSHKPRHHSIFKIVTKTASVVVMGAWLSVSAAPRDDTRELEERFANEIRELTEQFANEKHKLRERADHIKELLLKTDDQRVEQEQKLAVAKRQLEQKVGECSRLEKTLESRNETIWQTEKKLSLAKQQLRRSNDRLACIKGTPEFERRIRDLRKVHKARKALKPLVTCLFKRCKRFDLKHLEPNPNFPNVRQNYCAVFALCEAVFPSNRFFQNRHYTAYVIDILYEGFFCDQEGGTYSYQRKDLIAHIQGRLKEYVTYTRHIHKKPRHSVEDYVPRLRPLKSTESLVLTCKHGELQNDHAIVVRQKHAQWTFYDQYNPKGVLLGQAWCKDWKVCEVYRINSTVDMKALCA